jgi:hypothetical protein
MGSSFAVSTFDCSKLAAHPKLEKYVEECGAKKEAAKEPIPVAKAEEINKADAKQPGTADTTSTTDQTTDKKKSKK